MFVSVPSPRLENMSGEHIEGFKQWGEKNKEFVFWRGPFYTWLSAFAPTVIKWAANLLQLRSLHRGGFWDCARVWKLKQDMLRPDERRQSFSKDREQKYYVVFDQCIFFQRCMNVGRKKKILKKQKRLKWNSCYMITFKINNLFLCMNTFLIR